MACRANDICKSSAVLFADDISHVCGSSWRVGSLWCFHGHFFCYYYWFQLVDGNGKCKTYGAKQYRQMGILMQRAMLALLIVSIPLAFIWANTKSLLILAHQDPQIAEEAGIYAQFMIPSLFAYGLLQCLIRFLQTQNIVFPMMISSGITLLLHFPICWFLVFKSGLGSRGAAVANSVSYWINVLLSAAYVKFSSSCQKTWTGFSMEAFHNIVNFLSLAIPSTVMVCLETWSFEMMHQSLQ
ncbi:hypothetical protein QYF36_012017 [Acer negundo]|nr:hypothetical protein QYF36_012017 [Acer negundo]